MNHQTLELFLSCLATCIFMIEILVLARQGRAALAQCALWCSVGHMLASTCVATRGVHEEMTAPNKWTAPANTPGRSAGVHAVI